MKKVRKSTALALSGALAAGTLAIVTVVATPTASVAAPGNPGVPGTPTQLYIEDFEASGNNSNVALRDYVGDSGITYTGSDFWLSRANCNGFIINQSSPRRGGDCNNASGEDYGTSIYDALTAVPRAIGLFLGQGSAAANLNGAAASYTAGSTGDNEVQFETETPIDLPAANRFVTFSVDAGAENCFATHPELRFYLKNAAGNEIPVSTSAIDPCTDPRSTTISSVTQNGTPFNVSVGRFAANSSSLVRGNSLGIVMRNENGAGGGNDGAYDNIRVLDVTPQLDKSFSPQRVPTGGVSTLTLTVTNTSELAAKNGWAFTDTLPEGLTIASPNGVGGTCDADTAATAGGRTINITDGNLAAGQRSCTITVDVTSSTPNGADTQDKTYQNCAENISNVVGMNLPNCASVTFFGTSKLTIEKTSTPTTGVRVGDTVTYNVKATNTGDIDFTTAEPAFLNDDLTEVLDDATYNNDAKSSRGDAPTYATPTISWSGPLPVGESVTLTYTVKMTRGGDGSVDNLAFESPCDVDDPRCDFDPPPPTDPGCVDGVDPDTNLGCDPHEILLPKLTIEKSADKTELPKNTGTVHYTVKATNVGPGAYTAADPARVIDDLTNVIDDGELVESSVTVDRGDAPTYAAPKITWIGALAANEAVTIEYDVTYSAAKGGDNDLNNVAFGTEHPEGSTPTPKCDPVVNGVDPVTDQPCDKVSVPGADLEVTKSVDPKDRTTVVAGDSLTYTLTFDNDGKAGATVDYTDYLTKVLDDADVTAVPSVPANSGLTVTPIADGKFDIDGTVAPGATVTVTYTVKVKADGSRGDSNLGNFLADSNDPPPGSNTPCVENNPLCTENPVSQIEFTKSVDPTTGSTVVPGQVLTYTLTFKNVAKGDGKVDKVDDMTHVLDDAAVIKEPASSDSALKASAISNAKYSITGTVGAGKTTTVKYQVRVKPSDKLGDKQLANFVLLPNTPTPPVDSCTEGRTDCTFNPVGDVVAEKSVDPKNFSEVKAGEELTYTLTFTNKGKGKASVDYTDNMSGILDDADLVGDPKVSDPTLKATLRSGDKLRVTGELAGGQKVTVTYKAEVKDYSDQGDHQLLNFLVVTGDTSPASCKSSDPMCTSNKVLGNDDSILPDTGAEYGMWTAPIGLLLVALGSALVAMRRRREDSDDGALITE
jgi:uncharacterized repeat protein (TIGR01451 family)/fimbrial isopeptide formation D2 family protein/LPXTG-motif cell wall-anchored protein